VWVGIGVGVVIAGRVNDGYVRFFLLRGCRQVDVRVANRWESERVGRVERDGVRVIVSGGPVHRGCRVRRRRRVMLQMLVYLLLDVVLLQMMYVRGGDEHLRGRRHDGRRIIFVDGGRGSVTTAGRLEHGHRAPVVHHWFGRCVRARATAARGRWLELVVVLMVHRRDDGGEHVIVGADRRRWPDRGRCGRGPVSVVGGHQRLGRRVHSTDGRLIVGVVIFVGHGGRADRHERHVLLMLMVLLRVVVSGRGRVCGAH